MDTGNTARPTARPTVADMAVVVQGWVRDEWDMAARHAFVQCPEADLVLYHQGLGRHIRNHFHLWTYPWEPEIRGHVDHSALHPDALSQAVIVEVWERVGGRRAQAA